MPRKSYRRPTASARRRYRENRKKSQCVGKNRAFCARTRSRYDSKGGIVHGCKWASGPKRSFCRSRGYKRKTKRKSLR